MKQLTLIGIALLLLGVALVYISSLQFESNFANSQLQSAALSPGNSIAIPFQISNSTVLGSFYYANDSNVSYYLENAYVFSQISPYLNSSTLLNQSVRYEGSGVYEIIYKNSSGIFPDEQTSLLKSPSYYYNGSAIFASGTYYDVFQNSGTTSVLIYYSVVKKLQLSVNNSILATTIYGLFAAVLVFAGFCVIGYSLMFKRDEKKNAELDEKNVDALYSKYETNGPSKGHEHAYVNKHGKKKRR